MSSGSGTCTSFDADGNTAAFFQMWQTQAGAGSMEGAFMYSMASAITMKLVYLTGGGTGYVRSPRRGRARWS